MDWGDHHPDLLSIAAAAEEGCNICTSVHQRALRRCGSETSAICRTKYRVYKMEKDTTLQVLIDLTTEIGGREKDDCVGFYAVPQSTLTTSLHVQERDPSIPLKDAAATAGTWLDTCLNEHSQCRYNPDSLQYPKRLLQIDKSPIRLIVPAETSPTGPYIALSYCWGPEPDFIRLTADNMDTLIKGIPSSELPRAFQDTVELLRLLNIEYLWIDALCIIQSGPSCVTDWHHESARMDSTYSNAILTLAITRSADPNQSFTDCAKTRPALPFQISPVELVAAGSSKTSSFTVIPQHYFREGLYDLPLTYRAWAYQERLLAPRVLSIGAQETFWDCKQCQNVSETLPRGLSEVTDKGLLQVLGLAISEIPEDYSKDQLQQLWGVIIEDYTRRNLSFPAKDKLNALSAIASRFADRLGDVYIAGHFSDMLPDSLNWRVEPIVSVMTDEKKRARRITQLEGMGVAGGRHRMPTWSWASMDGPLFAMDRFPGDKRYPA